MNTTDADSILYPSKADSQGRARIVVNRHTRHLGTYGSPVSYIRFALLKAELQRSGTVHRMDSINARLRQIAPQLNEPMRTTRFHAAPFIALVVSLSVFTGAILLGTKLISDRALAEHNRIEELAGEARKRFRVEIENRRPVIQGVELSSEEVELVLARRLGKERMHVASVRRELSGTAALHKRVADAVHADCSETGLPESIQEMYDLYNKKLEEWGYTDPSVRFGPINEAPSAQRP